MSNASNTSDKPGVKLGSGLWLALIIILLLIATANYVRVVSNESSHGGHHTESVNAPTHGTESHGAAHMQKPAPIDSSVQTTATSVPAVTPATSTDSTHKEAAHH